MNIFMSSPPAATFSQLNVTPPPAPALPTGQQKISLPKAKSENFRRRLEIAFALRTNVRLELQMHKLDMEDTELEGRNRFMTSYDESDYYRCLQNEVLHCMTEEVKDATIAADFDRLMDLDDDLPEQLRPFDLADVPPPVTDVEKKVKRPVIYTHFHVDQHRLPPSAEEYQAIIDTMLDYIKVAKDKLGLGRLRVRDRRLRAEADDVDQQLRVIDPKDVWTGKRKPVSRSARHG